jgi:hypothetical protein
MGIGRDPHAPQVEAVSVPAGQERRGSRHQAVGVQAARVVQQVELRIVQVDQRAPQRSCELRAALAMPVVVELVHATRIVEEREQRDHVPVSAGQVGKSQPVLEHTRPMHDAMVAPLRQCVPVQDRLKDRRVVVRRMLARHGCGVSWAEWPRRREGSGGVNHSDCFRMAGTARIDVDGWVTESGRSPNGRA